LFELIICLVENGDFLMLGLAEIMLIVTIIMPGEKPTQHSLSMPDMATCLKEAEEFLNQDFPDTLNAAEVGAICKGTIPRRQPS
jgi:hypothetical protein